MKKTFIFFSLFFAFHTTHNMKKKSGTHSLLARQSLLRSSQPETFRALLATQGPQLRKKLEDNYDPNAEYGGFTLLTKTICLEKAKLRNSYVTLLLKHNADPCKEDRNKRLPLHKAIIEGYVNTATILLSHPNITDQTKAKMANQKESINGYTPLMTAAVCNIPEAVPVLLDHGANFKMLHDTHKLTAYGLAQALTKQGNDCTGFITAFDAYFTKKNK